MPDGSSTQSNPPTIASSGASSTASSRTSLIPPVRAVSPTPWPRRRTVLFYALLAGACALVYVFRQTLTLAFAAFAIAYVFAPVVRRVERGGVPRPLAVLVVLLTATALVGGVLSTLVPEVLGKARAALTVMPNLAATVQNDWIPWLRARHIPLPPDTVDVIRQLGTQASSMAPRLGTLLTGTLEYGAVIVETVFKTLVVLALSFYLLLDFDSLLDHAYDLIPHRMRGRASAVGHEINETMRHFVSGQLVVMAILATLYAAGLGIIGVPAGWAIGMFAGLISFVPYLGFFVALALALVMSALQGQGVGPVLAVVAVMAAVHILDLTFITPRFLGGRAKISPVMTLLALIAGGSVFGFIGVLVAIPLASVLRVLLREVIAYYKRSGFFTEGLDDSALQSSPVGLSALRTDPGFSPTPVPGVIQPIAASEPIATTRESKA